MICGSLDGVWRRYFDAPHNNQRASYHDPLSTYSYVAGRHWSCFTPDAPCGGGVR